MMREVQVGLGTDPKRSLISIAITGLVDTILRYSVRYSIGSVGTVNRYEYRQLGEHVNYRIRT